MFRSFAILASSNMAAQAINVIAYPILAHIYSPAAVGVFGIITALAVPAGIVACMRLDTIVQIERGRAELHLVRFAIALGIAVSVALGLSAYVPVRLSLLAGEPSAWGAAALAVFFALVSFLNGLYAVGNQFQVKHLRYGVVGRSQLVRVIVATLLQISLGLAIDSYWGLLIGFALASLIATAIVTPTGALIANWNCRSLKVGGRIARKRAKIIVVDCLNTLISTSFSSLQLLLITGLYGVAGTGLFVLASRLLFAPAQALGGALSTVYFQQLSHRVRTGQRLMPLFLKSLLAAAVQGAAMALAVIFLLPTFEGMFLPIKWAGVAPVGIALVPALIASVLLSGVGYTALSLGKPHLATGLNVYQIASLALAFVCSKWYALDLIGFVQIASALLFLGAACFTGLLYWVIRRHDAALASS
jgi:O-antigen/teichoic acid export membrane protein